MEIKTAFLKVMGESVNMALATVAEGKPNVRVVTFGYDEAMPGRLFFSTFKGSTKAREFAANPRVACMPLPTGPVAENLVRIFGEVKLSALTMPELVDIIGKKAQHDAGMLEEGAAMMDIYEIRFTEAWVTIGMSEAQKHTI